MDFTLRSLYRLGLVFIDMIGGLADFLLIERTFNIPNILVSSSDLGPVYTTFSGSTVELIIGPGLLFLLSFRMIKWFLDIIL